MLMTVMTTEEMEQFTIEQDIANKMWRRHLDGKIVNVMDMKDEYLQATIAMIKIGYDAHGRAVEKGRDRYLPMLEAEAVRRGLKPAEDGWDG